MRIGIIGAENSHTKAIATVINKDKKIPGFTVDYVWGETEAFAKEAAKGGKIPNIVKHSKEMLGNIDALIVDHRHAKYHLKAALPFVEAGVPTFVDKPFCFDSSEGKAFLRTAHKRKTPVTSFSTLPEQKSFKGFVKKAAALGTLVAGTSYGPCDPKSPYGGIFFYGIHQVDMVLHAFGYDVSTARVVKTANGAVGVLGFQGGCTVVMHLAKEGIKDFSITARGEKGEIHRLITRDESPYLNGVKTFTKMFRTGVEPLTDVQMLRPVQVLEAMAESLKTGEQVRVRR